MMILVLGGGKSNEREGSLRSAAMVIHALRENNYSVQEADPVAEHILDDLPPDTIVLPILHGEGGEDGTIQTQLEAHGLPYLGSRSIPSSLAFDKDKAKEVFKKAGLPVADGQIVTKETYPQCSLAKVPHVLKPAKGGSSIGIYLVRDPETVDPQQVDEVFSNSATVIIEELVNGVELTVGVLDGKALPVIEIQPPEGKFFDHENKYNGKTKELCPPVSINEVSQKRAQSIAEAAHVALGLRHWSRCDMIMRPNGDFVILEVNSIPGMTEWSLFPQAAEAAGLDRKRLAKKFIEMVIRDYKLKEVTDVV